MINEPDRQTITRWDKNRNGQQSLRLRKREHKAAEELDAFCREFSSLAPSVHITPFEEEKPFSGHRGLPGLVLKDNLIYSAIPLERELPPFLEGLDTICSRTPVPPPDIREVLEQIPAPCDLVLYIARQCPHCPGVVQTLLPLAVFSDKVRLTVIDGSLFPEAAQKDRVMSAPCLLLGEEFRWTGAVPALEIINMMVRQDPAKLGMESLRGIIEEGNAQWITDQMVKAHTIFPSFVKLLLHDAWSVRLGAMVIVESLGENHPGLAKKICPLLMDAFSGKDIPVQGDILYALGQAGGRNEKEWIASRLNALDHPDLKEAAEDALEDIDSRIGQ